MMSKTRKVKKTSKPSTGSYKLKIVTVKLSNRMDKTSAMTARDAVVSDIKKRGIRGITVSVVKA